MRKTIKFPAHLEGHHLAVGEEDKMVPQPKTTTVAWCCKKTTSRRSGPAMEPAGRRQRPAEAKVAGNGVGHPSLKPCMYVYIYIYTVYKYICPLNPIKPIFVDVKSL